MPVAELAPIGVRLQKLQRISTHQSSKGARRREELGLCVPQAQVFEDPLDDIRDVDERTEQLNTDRRLETSNAIREICVNQLYTVMHSDADYATDVPVIR